MGQNLSFQGLKRLNYSKNLSEIADESIASKHSSDSHSHSYQRKNSSVIKKIVTFIENSNRVIPE